MISGIYKVTVARPGHTPVVTVAKLDNRFWCGGGAEFYFYGSFFDTTAGFAWRPHSSTAPQIFEGIDTDLVATQKAGSASTYIIERAAGEGPTTITLHLEQLQSFPL